MMFWIDSSSSDKKKYSLLFRGLKCDDFDMLIVAVFPGLPKFVKFLCGSGLVHHCCGQPWPDWRARSLPPLFQPSTR